MTTVEDLIARIITEQGTTSSVVAAAYAEAIIEGLDTSDFAVVSRSDLVDILRYVRPLKRTSKIVNARKRLAAEIDLEEDEPIKSLSEAEMLKMMEATSISPDMARKLMDIAEGERLTTTIPRPPVNEFKPIRMHNGMHKGIRCSRCGSPRQLNSAGLPLPCCYR